MFGGFNRVQVNTLAKFQMPSGYLKNISKRLSIDALENLEVSGIF